MADGTISTVLSDDGAVATVRVDRRDKLNVVDQALCRALAAAVTTAGAEADLRVIVLEGAGERAFIGGADVTEMAALTPATARAFIADLHGVCAAIRAAPVPVLAKIRGYCLGGGLEVAAACDLRVAASDARFGMPEVRVGIPSVIEAALLPSLIGWGRTRRLLYTGEMIDAETALAWGLVEQVVAPDALDEAADAIVRAVSAAGPAAIRAQKALIGRWETLFLDQAIAAGVHAFESAFTSDEPKRYMAAFLNRSRTGKADGA